MCQLSELIGLIAVATEHAYPLRLPLLSPAATTNDPVGILLLAFITEAGTEEHTSVVYGPVPPDS